MHGISTIFGCIILATYTHQQGVTVTITGGSFQKLNTDVNGNCDTNGAAKDDGELYATNNTYDCRQTPQAVSTLKSLYGAEVTKEVGSVQFDKLASDEIKVVNIWCGAPINQAANCEPVIFYELKVTNTSDGYDCELRFAADLLTSKDYGSSFKRPSEVEWKVNGNSLSPAVSKSLGASDFADEQDHIKSIKYPLEIEAEKRVGTFSCEFTFTGSSEAIKSEISVSAEPVGVSWRTEPEKEQFSDNDDVKISCAFTGSPTPTITWTHEGESFTGEANITSKGNQIISTITLMDVEDSKDRGTYSCLAKNINGETTIEGILHVRDKLAPLWPFIGIVVQVIILAICIYIGEKIRKKKHAEKQRKRQRQTEGLSDDTSATRT